MEGAEIIEKMEEQNNRNLEEVTFKRKNDRPEVNASKQKDSSQKKSVIDDRNRRVQKIKTEFPTRRMSIMNLKTIKVRVLVFLNFHWEAVLRERLGRFHGGGIIRRNDID